MQTLQDLQGGAAGKTNRLPTSRYERTSRDHAIRDALVRSDPHRRRRHLKTKGQAHQGVLLSHPHIRHHLQVHEVVELREVPKQLYPIKLSCS